MLPGPRCRFRCFLLGSEALGCHGDAWVSTSKTICVVVVCHPKEEAARTGQTHNRTHSLEHDLSSRYYLPESEKCA